MYITNLCRLSKHKPFTQLVRLANIEENLIFNLKNKSKVLAFFIAKMASKTVQNHN